MHVSKVLPEIIEEQTPQTEPGPDAAHRNRFRSLNHGYVQTRHQRLDQRLVKSLSLVGSQVGTFVLGALLIQLLLILVAIVIRPVVCFTGRVGTRASEVSRFWAVGDRSRVRCRESTS